MPVKEDEASDSEEELFEDLEDMEVGRAASKAPAKESKTKAPEESDEDEDEEEEHPKIGKTLLIVGILLCIAGLIGVVGLRTNVIQHILGDPDPYPGIGYVEPWGHIVSVFPFVLGFIFMLAWGIKNDPVYYENQKRKEEEKEEEEDMRLMPMPIDQADVPEELSKPLEGAEENAPVDLDQAQPTQPTEAVVEEERIAKCEKMLAVASVLPDDRERLKLLIPSGISAHDFTEEVKKVIEKKKKKEAEKKLSADEKAAMLEEELAAELAELEDALDKGGDDDELEEKILKEIEDLENL